MSILKYFQQVTDDTAEKLPNPQGSLSKRVPSSAIERANTNVTPIIEQLESGKRRPYLILTPAPYEDGRQSRNSFWNMTNGNDFTAYFCLYRDCCRIVRVSYFSHAV